MKEGIVRQQDFKDLVYGYKIYSETCPEHIAGSPERNDLESQSMLQNVV